MSRVVAAAMIFGPALFGFALLAQERKPADPQKQQEQEPPEEDNSFKPRTYDFNPLKASQSITAGNFYFDKKNYSAAKNRYVDATLFDPGNGEAFEKLGEAQEKLHNFPASLEAFKKFFEMEPASKEIVIIKKRMERWPASSRPPAAFLAEPKADPKDAKK